MSYEAVEVDHSQVSILSVRVILHQLTYMIEQQITLYPHRDDNNIWRIVNASDPTGEGPHTFPWDDLPFQQVLAGTKIRLEHVVTEKRLHSHDVRPPISEVDFQNEVSAYGFPG